MMGPTMPQALTIGLRAHRACGHDAYQRPVRPHMENTDHDGLEFVVVRQAVSARPGGAMAGRIDRYGYCSQVLGRFANRKCGAIIRKGSRSQKNLPPGLGLRRELNHLSKKRRTG